MRMRKQIIIFVLLFICSVGFKASDIYANGQNKWPSVTPLKRTFHFIDGKLIESKLTITGKDNSPLYLLECYLNAFDKKDKTFDYTGAFECRLTPLYDDNYDHKNLLTDQNPQLRDWHSRGVFKIDEIQCKNVEDICIEYPGYGKVRHFRLRGMLLSVEIKSFKIDHDSKTTNHLSGDRIKELELEITVTPDPNATSIIAEPVNLNEMHYSKIKWPEIFPIKKTMNFHDHQGNQLEIASKNGTSLYLLQCYLNPSDDDSDRDKFDYSGDFECRLTSLYDKRQNTLLTENPYPTRDWESRGRFLIEEITGECTDYPEYGRLRDFKLRGMNLRFEIKNINLSTDINKEGKKITSIKDVEIEISIVSDPTAISEIAEPTKYIEPLFRDPKNPNKFIRDCGKVLMK
jgi:hypothetical protein